MTIQEGVIAADAQCAVYLPNFREGSFVFIF